MIKGRCDFKDLQRFQEKMEVFTEKQREKFINAVAKELAARLIARVAKRTPVQTGALRRGWTAKTHEEAVSGSGAGKNPIAYANSLPIVRKGNVYEIEVINPVKYGSYVEYGHRQEAGRYVHAIRKRLKKSWVEGRFFLTKSKNELENEAPEVIEKKLAKELKKVLG